MLSSERLKEDDAQIWGGNWQGRGHSRIPQLGERPYSAIWQQSYHHRTMTEDIRRPNPSPMQSRGRSNTSTSRDYSSNIKASQSTNQTEGMSHDRLSTSISIHSRNERPGSLSKTLKTKASRLLRRQENEENLTSLRTVDWSKELDESPYEPGSSLSLRRKTRQARRGSPAEGSTMQWIISEPFNFQHLTHTERNQYQQIQEASHDDFVSEFSAMRASQVPRRELRGIKAETIARQDPSETPPSIPTSPYCSPPRTPRRPSDGLPKSSPNHSPRAISHEPSTSIDSFAHHNLQPKQEMESQYTLPSRSVLRYSPPQFSTPGQGDEESPVESCFEASIASEDSTPYDIPIATFDGAAYDFTTPHAVTTPDDAAHILTPPPFEMVRTELSRVVEEDEHSEGRRSSTTTLARRPSASGSSLRHVKSFPSTRQPLEQSGDPVANTYRENVQSSPKKQRRSIKILQPSFDDAICDVPLSRQSQRFSATFKDAEGNWEDLVDWCYDHNAEADCNFDFTRAGSPVPEVGTQTAENPEDDLGTLHSIEGGLHSGAFKARRSSSVYSTSPPALPPLQTSLPELEPASAISAQSSFASVSEAITPVQSTTDLLPTQFSLSGSKTSFSKPTGHHSPHVSNDHTSHEMYEDLCQEMYSRDSYQYGRIDGSTISSASPRSSHSPISKCSSQESFWARHHKANSSASSLPDLVHNRSSREKAEPFPDILAEQMAPLNEEQQALASRRRSPGSLVKDVAQKNLLSRIQNGSIDDATNAEVPLPLHPALRDRAGSEAAFRDPDLVVPPFARPPTARMRSASSAANVKSVNISPRGSRASYGLYPKHTVR